MDLTNILIDKKLSDEDRAEVKEALTRLREDRIYPASKNNYLKASVFKNGDKLTIKLIPYRKGELKGRIERVNTEKTTNVSFDSSPNRTWFTDQGYNYLIFYGEAKD